MKHPPVRLRRFLPLSPRRAPRGGGGAPPGGGGPAAGRGTLPARRGGPCAGALVWAAPVPCVVGGAHRGGVAEMMLRTAVVSLLLALCGYAAADWLTHGFQVWTDEGARRLEGALRPGA